MESNDNNRLEDLLRKMYAENDIDTSEIIDEEWQKFEARHFPQKQRSWGWMQIAAIFIGVLMLSGITYAAIHIASNIESKPKVAITNSQRHRSRQTTQR